MPSVNQYLPQSVFSPYVSIIIEVLNTWWCEFPDYTFVFSAIYWPPCDIAGNHSNLFNVRHAQHLETMKQSF